MTGESKLLQQESEQAERADLNVQMFQTIYVSLSPVTDLFIWKDYFFFTLVVTQQQQQKQRYNSCISILPIFTVNISFLPPLTLGSS